MMSKKKLSVVFFGTPDFAVPSLDALLTKDYDVKLVVTNPDRPAGRKLQLIPSTIKQFSIEKGLPIAQPEDLRDQKFIQQLEEISPDIMVVIAFKKLPNEVWSIPHLGTINIHPSLLPDYRGAAPINWAIINGEKETGVSIIRINDQLDSGGILSQKKISIQEDVDFGYLHDQLKIVGAEMLIEVMEDLIQGKSKTILQEHLLSDKKAPKIYKEDCKISFEKTAQEVVNLVRGLHPYPCAYLFLEEKYIKVLKAHIGEHAEESSPVGQVLTDHKNYLKIRCSDKYVYIDELQPEGKKRMQVKDFLVGWRNSK